MISIIRTEFSKSLVNFFIENGLEFSAEEEVPTDLVQTWKAYKVLNDVPDESQMNFIGGCVLAKREGRFICDGIAVEERVRGSGIGEGLLFTMIDEVRSLGGDTIYLVARAPGFFRKNGFETIPREDAPNFFECFSCSQYNVSCYPEVMMLSIGT